MKFKINKSNKVVDINKIFYDLQDKYSNIYMDEICGQVFIYKTIGRQDWKNIVENDETDVFDKEEIICINYVLYPEDYDFKNCEEAGLPTELSKRIIENSLLDSTKIRDEAMFFYRQQMFDIENQITCIINEAFPEFSIEEIENWDIDRTTKYMSRAEWKLQNFKGINFDTSKTFSEALEETNSQQTEELETEELEDEELEIDENTDETTNKEVNINNKTIPKEKDKKVLNHRGQEKKKLSLEELKEKFPNINWGNVDHSKLGAETFRNLSTVPVALREDI